MPANETLFHNAIEVLKFLEKLNKNTVICTQDFRVNMLPQKYRQGVIDFGITDINRLNLPAASFEKRIREFEFDVVIDLEKDENLFNSFLTCLVKAQVRIGFKKRNSDKFYSLQIDNIEDNPEIIYKNLLNCLQMF
jgi:ribosomal protein L5